MTAPRQIVVIGASAGGIDALRAIVAALPDDLPSPVCVVVHTSPMSPGILDEILSRAGRLPASQAVNGERLRERHIYVARPDHHLVVEPGIVRVTRGPRENRFRPAIDPLFRSAAQVFGPGAIGVILTGGLDDGTDGLWAIKQLGGVAIVQDPEEAECPSMPRHAIEHVRVDHVVRVAEIGPLLTTLTSVAPAARHQAKVQSPMHVEVKIAMEENPIEAGLESIGTPSPFACPECHGVLLEMKGGALPKFRCHTGHAFSLSSLVAAIGEGIESSMWEAVRSLEEGQLLMTRVVEHFSRVHHHVDLTQVHARAHWARKQADAIRHLLMHERPPALTRATDD